MFLAAGYFQSAHAYESLGVIVPLYSYPGVMWDNLIHEKESHKSVPVLAIINPDNGPGKKDQNYVIGVKKLEQAGITVLGYVYTRNVDATEIRAYMDDYKNWYGVDGIFFDAMSNMPGNETFYKDLTNYSKSMGLNYTVGNPGADTLPSYVGTVDNIVLRDNQNLPPSSLFGGWHEKFAKSNFSFISYGVSNVSKNFVQLAAKHFGYLYLTDLTLPNPFYALPANFGSLMNILGEAEENQQKVAVTINAYDSSGKSVSGLWTTVKAGTNNMSGFTPFSFDASAGQKYRVTISSFGNYTFEHWDDNETNNTRVFSPQGNVTLSAYFGIKTNVTIPTANVGLNATGMANVTTGGLPAAPTPANSTSGPLHESVLPNTPQTPLGSVNVNIMYYGGDRADYSLLSFKIYQDTNKTLYREISSVSSNPFVMGNLPLYHTYKIEVFANGMCSDIEYLDLEKPRSQMDLYLSPPGGMRLHIFYKDGYTPVPDAVVYVKSQDNKTWATSRTDDNGETLRFWLEPTVMKNNYFVIQVKIGQNISYSYWPVFLTPGSAQEVMVDTPWPRLINNPIDIKVYGADSSQNLPREGNLAVEMIDTSDKHISEMQLTPRGDATFGNLKVGDYVVKAIDLQDNETIGQSSITVDGKETTFDIFAGQAGNQTGIPN
ncbi:MAG: hypothetical protein KGI33_07625 [Thaumarchaeota archaeon]|nr:hypothetical protein [Nitrososphaerota archaeon]